MLMPVEGYYGTLGVSRSETPAGIRAADRDFAKRLPQSTAAFQDIAEAYAVFSDSARRRMHDQDLRTAEERAARFLQAVAVEPLAPEPPSFLDSPENVHPSFDEVYARYVRNFTGRDVPKAESAQSLTLEIVLTAEEAALGCLAAIGVPVMNRCAACGGTGQDWLFPCHNCRGSGLIERRRTLWVPVHRSTPAGTAIEAPLDSFGVYNFYLHLHISVGET